VDLPDALTISEMTEREVSAALVIDLASFPESGPETGDAWAARREAHLKEELARAWARLRVARTSSGEVLGYVLFWHVVDEIHLLSVAVEPTARRRGVGRALVNDVLSYAKAHAPAKILLEVRASNVPAITLYETLGFVRFNVRERYYPDGEDGVEMMLEVLP
jgi:ribosomal-protein-alanine N-acetyltransferase